MYTEIKPTFGIDPIAGLDSIIDTAQPILDYLRLYVKFRHLSYKLNVARLKTTSNMNVPLPRAKIEFI
jgi:hypothetical protein